jgi:hypothetical protein
LTKWLDEHAARARFAPDAHRVPPALHPDARATPSSVVWHWAPPTPSPVPCAPCPHSYLLCQTRRHAVMLPLVPSSRAPRTVPSPTPSPCCMLSKPAKPWRRSPFSLHPWMLSKGELLEAGAPSAYAHYRHPPWALCHGASHPAPLHHLLSTPPPHKHPLHLPRPPAHRLSRPVHRNRSTSALKSMVPPNFIAVRSSPQPSTGMEPQVIPHASPPLSRPSPTFPSPETSSLSRPWRQGLNCDCSFCSRDLSIRNRDLFVKIQFSDLDPNAESCKICPKSQINHKNANSILVWSLWPRATFL